MATFRKSVAIIQPDANCFPDAISNQIAGGTAPSVGNLLAYVLADAGADEGVYVQFNIPKNYVGTPKLVIKAILDGTPAAGADLAWGFRKRAVADDEVAAGTFDAEQTVQDTDISDHADTDLIVLSIDLTAGDYAVDDIVFGYVFVDASGTTYTGNLLLVSVEFEYTDA